MSLPINRCKRYSVHFLRMAIYFIWILTSGYFSVLASADTSLVWQYAYDAEGRIAEIQSPSGDIHYEYSSITGRKTATWTGTDPQNQFNRTEYTYDDLGRLKEVRAVRCNGVSLDPAYITRYSYNPVGSVETITYPNGFHSVYNYNALNRLTLLTHYLSSQPNAMMLARYEYSYFADGMRATTNETLWNSDALAYDTRQVQWTYDNLNRVTEEKLIGGYTLQFQYDLVGNCLRRTLDGTATYFFYNDNDELLKESPNADGSSPSIEYGYDDNGSLMRKTDHVGSKETIYAYNLQNRLESVSENGQEIASYLYNPEGFRLGKQAGGTMVWYLSDPYNPTGYVQVLEEVSDSHTTAYFLGLHVLGQMTDLDDPMFFLLDGHGSTRQTVQAPVTTLPPTAPTMQQIHYDAYGKLIPGAVSPGTNVLYTNQRFDPVLKMYDLRQREYDPANMRFTQHDPWTGSIDDPMSLHRYLYCNANPINSIDPTGCESIPSLMTSFSIKAMMFRAGVGATLGTIDAHLRGYSKGQGATMGAVGGIFGPWVPLRLGYALGGLGVADALYAEDYDSALFRVSTLGVGVFFQNKGFSSYAKFKEFFGKAGPGKSFHHIVEQTPLNKVNFAPEKLHNPNNIVPLPRGAGSVHAKLSGFYSSKQPRITGPGYSTVRQWLSTKSFEEQYIFGLQTLAKFGGSTQSLSIAQFSTSWEWPATLEEFSEIVTEEEE